MGRLQGLARPDNHLRPDQGAIGPPFGKGVQGQIELVAPGAHHHPAPAQEKVGAEHGLLPLFQLQGRYRVNVPGPGGKGPFLGAHHGPAAAEQAGLRGMGGMAGALVAVIGDEEVDGIAGGRMDKAGADIIVRPEGRKDFRGKGVAGPLPVAKLHGKGVEAAPGGRGVQPGGEAGQGPARAEEKGAEDKAQDQGPEKSLAAPFRPWPGEVCFGYPGPGGRGLFQEPGQPQEQGPRGKEDDKAKGVMGVILGKLRQIMDGEQAGDPDPHRIDQDGQGNGQGHNQCLPPAADQEEMADEQGHEQHGDHIAQAAAGVHHLELAQAEVQDIAIHIDADPGGPEHHGGELAGQQLEFEGEGLVEIGRQRHHEEQDQEGKEELDQAPAVEGGHDPEKGGPEPDEDQGFHGPGLTGQEQERGKQGHGQPGKAPGEAGETELFPLFPAEEEKKGDHQIAVGVVAGVPGDYQPLEHRPIAQGKAREQKQRKSKFTGQHR